MSGEDADLLAERFDPEDRGKVDLQALVVWLTSGFDAVQVCWGGLKLAGQGLLSTWVWGGWITSDRDHGYKLQHRHTKGHFGPFGADTPDSGFPT